MPLAKFLAVGTKPRDRSGSGHGATRNSGLAELTDMRAVDLPEADRDKTLQRLPNRFAGRHRNIFFAAALKRTTRWFASIVMMASMAELTIQQPEMAVAKRLSTAFCESRQHETDVIIFGGVMMA